MEKVETQQVCEVCGEETTKGNGYEIELYDTPWDDTPRMVWVHGENHHADGDYQPNTFADRHYKEGLGIKRGYPYGDCLDLLSDTGYADFRYFECVDCGRMVCEQNPCNGWHSQYRDTEEGQICLKCYETAILRDGVDREALESGKLPGMFFSRGNSEATEAGFAVVEGFEDVFIGDPQPTIDKALSLIDAGNKVVIAYESMAIGGLEGYVTLLAKKD